MKKHSFLLGIVSGLVSGLATISTAVVLVTGLGAAVRADDAASAVQAETLAEVADALIGADVIILGEVHDNLRHHQVQADLVEALQPRALVWEMITQAQAEGLTTQNLQDPDAIARALDWQASGWPEFSLYAPVFKAAEQAAHFGALVPRAESQAALKAGVASHFGADAKRFGLDQPLPKAEQAAREAEQMANHCNAMPEEILPMRVDFQRLRDTSLAAAAETALRQTGGPVVVITGNGHARLDRGLAIYLARAMPDSVIRALGQMEDGSIQGQFDVVLSAPAVPRPDPCLAFSKSE